MKKTTASTTVNTASVNSISNDKENTMNNTTSAAPATAAEIAETAWSEMTVDQQEAAHDNDSENIKVRFFEKFSTRYGEFAVSITETAGKLSKAKDRPRTVTYVKVWRTDVEYAGSVSVNRPYSNMENAKGRQIEFRVKGLRNAVYGILSESYEKLVPGAHFKGGVVDAHAEFGFGHEGHQGIGVVVARSEDEKSFPKQKLGVFYNVVSENGAAKLGEKLSIPEMPWETDPKTGEIMTFVSKQDGKIYPSGFSAAAKKMFQQIAKHDALEMLLRGVKLYATSWETGFGERFVNGIQDKTPDQLRAGYKEIVDGKKAYAKQVKMTASVSQVIAAQSYSDVADLSNIIVRVNRGGAEVDKMDGNAARAALIGRRYVVYSRNWKPTEPGRAVTPIDTFTEARFAGQIRTASLQGRVIVVIA